MHIDHKETYADCWETQNNYKETWNNNREWSSFCQKGGYFYMQEGLGIFFCNFISYYI